MAISIKLGTQFSWIWLTPQDPVTLQRRQQHAGQTETRCFDLSGHGVTLPARLSFTYS